MGLPFYANFCFFKFSKFCVKKWYENKNKNFDVRKIGVKTKNISVKNWCTKIGEKLV